MEIVNKGIITNSNNFYIDTINNLLFTPNLFIKRNYLEDLSEDMENRLINNKINKSEQSMIKLIIGLCNEKLEEYFCAINIFNELIQSKEFIKDSFIMGALYISLSLTNLKINNMELQKKYFNLSKSFLEDTNQFELLLFLYINTSIINLKIYKFDLYLYNNIDSSFKILSEHEYKYSSQAYLMLGIIYYKYLSLNNISIKLLNKALYISKINNQNEIEILANYHIASVNMQLYKFKDSTNLYKNILNNYDLSLPVNIKMDIYIKLLQIYMKSNENLDDINKLFNIIEKSIYKLDIYHIDSYLIKYNLLLVQYKISKTDDSIIDPSLNDLFYYLDNAYYIYKSNITKFKFMEFDYWLKIAYGNLFYRLNDYDNALFHHKKSLLYSEKYKNMNTINSYKLIYKDFEALENYKEALNYLKASTETLESYNIDKNSDIYIQLFDDYENLKCYHSIKNDFFSNLSHELRTPINIIYSSVQLISSLKDRDPDSIKEYFFKYEKSVRQNCLRMLKLINNLIDITKIDSGSAKLNLVTLDIVSFIEDLTLSIIPYTRYKKLNVTFDTNVEKLYMNLDTYALEKILLNLLSNAIKFTNPNGNILVKINSNNNFTKIIVRDDGIGIPSNLKNLIFDKFFKVDDTLSRNTEGSGIGLSITKGLVEMHGGFIIVNDEYTNGTELIVNLPTQPKKQSLKNSDFKYFIDDEKIIRELSDIYELF
ncbi:HAMP domain-containing histidine kinase [Clostridium sp. DSM 100503]|uniref:ATP-binding protein n=1 Tax=Clostridium sp. DSM 100503 TaxID=2963282 RepID=UPI00214A3C60|nr:tetratricopeptide repeat-containing sensor histidine kinase [Clostridium sp. DSM 100503]MCR1949465.1 HAMP domain-containing histidine kinase [Clostridium sp. DSM 100503]